MTEVGFRVGRRWLAMGVVEWGIAMSARVVATSPDGLSVRPWRPSGSWGRMAPVALGQVAIGGLLYMKPQALTGWA